MSRRARTRRREASEKRVYFPGQSEPITCRSFFEADIGRQLAGRGLSPSYESHQLSYSEPIRNGYCAGCGGTETYRERNYLVDFVLPKGDVEIVLEVKGTLDAEERRKFEAIREDWDTLDIRFIFMRNNWLTKAHKARYSDWAERVGYPYCVGKISDEWLEELEKYAQ